MYRLGVFYSYILLYNTSLLTTASYSLDFHFSITLFLGALSLYFFLEVMIPECCDCGTKEAKYYAYKWNGNSLDVKYFCKKHFNKNRCGIDFLSYQNVKDGIFVREEYRK